MTIVLVGFEIVMASLLFAAMLMIIGLRRKTRTAAAVICSFGILLGLIPVGLMVTIAGILRFVAGMRKSGFEWAIAMACVCIVSMSVLRIAAIRRDAAGVRRGVLWPLGRFASFWAVVMALIVMTVWNLDLQGQMEIQALRSEAGAIVLSVTRPPVDDSANAAIVYARAEERFKASTVERDEQVDELDAGAPEVAAYLIRQQKALELVRTAADMPECRVEDDSINVSTILQELSRFRTAANLLAIAARAEAATGEVNLALADCRRIYGVGHHANATPMLISNLVAIGVDAIASTTLAKVLPSVTNKDQLARFAPLDPEALSRDLARDLQGEEALGMAAMCDMASGKAMGFNRVSGAAMWHMWLRDDVPVYRKNIQRVRGTLSQPFYQSAAERKAIDDELAINSSPFLRVLTPSLHRAVSRMVEVQALRSAVNVAVAATYFRLEHGEYPATPELLIPGKLDAMPADPFDGKPLRMTKLADGSLVVYSIGVDGVDNGGDVEAKDDKHRPADVGFVLKMPSRR